MKVDVLFLVMIWVASGDQSVAHVKKRLLDFIGQ